MAQRDRQHIFVSRPAQSEAYRRPRRLIPRAVPPRPDDALGHGAALRTQLVRTVRNAMDPRRQAGYAFPGLRQGAVLVFESFPGVELALESLDPQVGRDRIELRAVREVEVDGQRVEQAVVYVPPGKEAYFLRRIDKYVETAITDNPRNRNLVDRISRIRLATLELLWTDPASEFPGPDESIWWEVWLRRRDGLELERLSAFATQAGLHLGSRSLGLLDRIVVPVRGTARQLSSALAVLEDLAEVRSARVRVEVLASEQAFGQAEWVADLAARIEPAPDASPAVCVMDTGVHQVHPLLVGSLTTFDCHACNAAWQVRDHHGHGTEMAGLALFGDLGLALTSTQRLALRHRLESVKILPPAGQTDERLYGAITATAASLVEIQAPRRRRVFSCAVTFVAHHDGPPATGQPTSWSAAVDALASGASIDVRPDGLALLSANEGADARLFVLAAGNNREVDADYLVTSDLEVVEDPAQAWNAISVGAWTDRVEVDPDDGFDGWIPIAPRGDLSPSTRTSVAFDRAWPPKPEILLEGGNVVRSPSGELGYPDSLQLLTTKAPIHNARLLTTTRETSAATAQAAHLAAEITASYPTLWPETVRALLVHSAQWTPQMRSHLDPRDNRAARDAFRRRYGMGVPSLERATKSATDALTLVVQDVIRPFDGTGRLREMHLHELPWPATVLADMGEAQVSLRVTLSYFITPNPGRRGWLRRYSYPSHGLRFDLRRPTESTDEFRSRLNELARAEEEERPIPAAADAHEWFFGPDLRSSGGSLHTDIWSGMAVSLARRGVVAIYPISGWWKERPRLDQSERGARYALVVSIEAAGQDVDLWTPVANEVGVAIATEI